jgi:NADP-reducing hydrogenase subunit HndB
MPKLAGVDDLMRVREEILRSREAGRKAGTTIYIGMGTCGIAAGARETMSAIQAELARRKIDVRITAVGCLGMCVREPLVDIQRPGELRVTYANVRPDMVPRLIEEHLVKGRPVAEWVLGQMPSDW